MLPKSFIVLLRAMVQLKISEEIIINQVLLLISLFTVIMMRSKGQRVVRLIDWGNFKNRLQRCKLKVSENKEVNFQGTPHFQEVLCVRSFAFICNS